MSLEFNRRSFLKYTAAAAVVVAGSSLLTGCGTEFAKTIKKFGTIDNMDVKANLSSGAYQAPTSNTSDGKLAFAFEIKNNHTNPVYLNGGSFTITIKYTETDPSDVTKKVTKTKIYNSASGSSYVLTNPLFSSGDGKNGIVKGKSASGYIYLEEVPVLTENDTITVLYHCDSAFSKFADIWELTYNTTNFPAKTITLADDHSTVTLA